MSAMRGVVIHVPHASTTIPTELRDQFVVSDTELADEVRIMTDHLTDRLFDVPGVTAVRFPVSRLVLDPERFESDDEEVMAGRGMGVIYTRTSRQTPLRRELLAQEREQLLERWYRPHHAALTTAVEATLERQGGCLVIDAHSFPPRPLPYELDQNPDRPDICIGTDKFHTPVRLTELATRLCREAGWTVQLNRPFAGALVPRASYRTDARVSGVMIEVNRRLYMDERTGEPSPDFDSCREKLSTVLAALIVDQPHGDLLFAATQ